MKHLSFIILFISMIGCSKNDSSSNTGDEQLNLDAPAKPLTAKYSHDAIQTYVASLGTGYSLSYVSSTDVTSEGLAIEWSFSYKNITDTVTFMQRLCYMRSCNDSVRFDSVVTKKFTVGDAVISEKWMNSDIALSIAEKNGGKQFREKNPDYIISAGVSAGVLPVRNVIWYVIYSSTVDLNIHFSIRLNAVTGSVEITNQ
jgi:hypothetical protein